MKHNPSAITKEEVLKRLNYDPETGVFTWKLCRNSKHIGNIAKSLDAHGYVQINLMGTVCKGHRLAWFYMTGEWPKDQIDHINMKRDDNRFSNLRLATNAENSRNREVQSNNTSGFKGVSFNKNTGKFVAYIEKDKKRKNLGYFADAISAHEARARVEVSMFGEFARC